VNVGVIGAGNISDTHARAAVAAGLRIAGVYGENQEKARQLADRHGASAFTTLDALLAHQPLDLVLIGSPSGRHADHAIAAARTGCHVLVEKPLDISTARVDQLIEEATRARVTVGVFFQDRLKPEIVEMKRRIDAGEIGVPLLATGEVKWFRPREYYSSSRWRGTWALDGGGALMNQGIHTVDLMLYLLGPVAAVSGLTATRFHTIEAEDTATALLEFVNGAQGTIDVTTAAASGSPRRLRIAGSEGSLLLEGDRLIETTDGPTAPPPMLENAASPVVTDVSNHQRIIVDFIDAIHRRRAPVCDAVEGRRSVAVVEAIYRSAREQRRVNVELGTDPPFQRLP
jgi:UDP-N-acetyl-2-amino-2-deoxyglucuronate dehydrogenase